jgi:hypothetical protein
MFRHWAIDLDREVWNCSLLPLVVVVKMTAEDEPVRNNYWHAVPQQ